MMKRSKESIQILLNRADEAHWDCVRVWGQQQPAVMCGFPVFPASLLLRPGAWFSQCRSNGGKTSPVHMCWAEVCFKAQKTSRMLSDRNPDGGGVVLCICFVTQLADNVFLADL